MSSSKRFNNREDSDFKFAKIHIPKMRSVFWKYFGFPANENDEIITKQKVVCTLCHAVLRNHCNTTNIRAHVQSTHKSVFAELITKHGIQIPPRKVQKKVKLGSTKFEDPIIYEDHKPLKRGLRSFSSSTVIHDEDSINILEAIPLTYEDTDQITKDDGLSDVESATFLHKRSNMVDNLRTDIANHVNEKSKCVAPFNFSVDINPIQLPIEYDVEDALRKVIIKDLQNVSTIYSCAMQEFITGILSNQILIPLCKIETSIRNIHTDKFSKLRDKIKVHSQVKLYSLSFDVWTNIDNKEFVSIYFNNVSEEYENQFCDNLYVTVVLNDYTMFDQIFDEFNLENCSAAVINCNHKILNTFLSNNDIPIVYCFSYIVNTCIKDVFNIPEVSNIFDDVQDVIARYTSEICTEEVDIPTVCKEFPLTKVAVLKFFCENVFWPEDLELLISNCKKILDTISPLEVTLDTLKEEEIPLSSLFLPFADKIIQKHFVINEYDDNIQCEIKSIVVREFKRSICSNNYLAVTALLDPRFHKFISVKNASICLSILEKKYSQISKHRGETQKCPTVKVANNTSKIPRKSHLMIFFDVDACPPVKNAKTDIFIENDLRHYRDEAFASLEESPLMWWSQWGNTYGSLKYLAEAYNCILGFVNMSFKNTLKDQIIFHRKRFMLTGSLIDQILFLNKNY